MLFKHKHLLEELREKGRHATAEIISVQTEGGGNSMRANWAPDDDLTTTWTDCKMDLRVLPPGESPFEVTVHTRLHTFKWAGEKVPVWYDPGNRLRVVVDHDEDAATKMRAISDAELSLHRNHLRPGVGVFFGGAASPPPAGCGCKPARWVAGRGVAPRRRPPVRRGHAGASRLVAGRRPRPVLAPSRRPARPAACR